MTDYVIAVRTYKRPHMFQSHTLQIIKEQGLLDRLYVFVGSDISEYAALEPTLRYIQAPVGGHNAIRAICEYFPHGHPIVFLDDDLGQFRRYDICGDVFHSTGLHDTLLYGFTQAPFGFGFMTNKMWLKELPLSRQRFSTMSGGCFGAYNQPELITTSHGHCDDLLRTIQYFKAGIIPTTIFGAGFKTKYGTNAGGLQASGDRDNTLRVCEEIRPQVEGWVSRLHQQSCGLWTWKLLPSATLKRKLGINTSRGPIVKFSSTPVTVSFD